MSTSKVQYRGENSNRGPSPELWADCPWSDLVNDPNKGYYDWDDFMSIPKTPPTTEGNFGRYRAFTSTGGTIADGGSVGGSVAIGSDGDNEGASIATNTFPFLLSASSHKLWFEARIKVSSIADTIADVFVGLIDSSALTATSPITATAGTLADVNYLGFHRLGTDGDMLDVVYRNSGQTAQTLIADAVTLTADTYVKVGWKYDPRAVDSKKFTFYANGVDLLTYVTATQLAAATFPNDANLGLAFAILNAAGSITPTATMDWWRIAQLSSGT